MTEIDLKLFETACREFCADLKPEVKLEWDDRFEAVLMQLGTDEANTLRDSLTKHFPAHWSKETCDNAPEGIRDVVESLGGLEQSQELFSTDPTSSSWILVAWWPWGNGNRVSLRVLFRTEVFGDFDLNNQFRAWFRV